MNRKRKNRKNYKRKVKMKRKERIKNLVTKIKDDNIVVNLSREDIPDSAYVFLPKGLGFIPSRKVDIQDLKYDASEFIRKLEWKAFFKAKPELQPENATSNIHKDIKVSGFTHPDFNSPILENI